VGESSAQSAGSSHHSGSASKPPTSIRDRAYACMEEYGVRVNCQEWPLTISYSPARTHSFETANEWGTHRASVMIETRSK
jgi:hypothetical protein